jgi:hypothetical protein
VPLHIRDETSFSHPTVIQRRFTPEHSFFPHSYAI